QWAYERDLACAILDSLSLRWGPKRRDEYGDLVLKSNRYHASTLLSAAQVLKPTYDSKNVSKDLEDVRSAGLTDYIVGKALALHTAMVATPACRMQGEFDSVAFTSSLTSWLDGRVVIPAAARLQQSDPVKFWPMVKVHPMLRRVAIYFCTMPASEAMVERSFSHHSVVHDMQKQARKNDIVQAILFL
ncbi:hypothetical protein KIPB_016559, partial [Kipferlia bialata]